MRSLPGYPEPVDDRPASGRYRLAGGRRAAQSAADGADGDSPVPDLRETYRRQLVDGIGGWTGTLITALPTVVFVIVNAVTALRIAIVAAVATAALLALYRLARRQSVQQALTGLFGVVLAAVVAARTGQARGYFLLGIWSSFGYAAVFGFSALVRRPVVGLAWEFLDPTPGGDSLPWYRRRGLLGAYVLATLGATAVFLARGIVQLALFNRDATGWLAVARIAMGYPLYVLALGFGFWIVTRARRQLAAKPSGP